MSHAIRAWARTSVGLAAILAVAVPLLALSAEAYKELGVDDVEKMLGARDVVIYDANPPDLYAKHHIPGAIFVTQKDLDARLPADKSTKLVFYCANTL